MWIHLPHLAGEQTLLSGIRDKTESSLGKVGAGIVDSSAREWMFFPFWQDT